jgi:trans-aconitate 2-methyltransferase
VTDWDATRYHRVSEPQFDWGQRVIARLHPSAGQRILDVGCGTGRLTREIIRAAGDGSGARVVGLDRSGSMLAVARADAAVSECPIGYVQADGAALPFANAFDAIFSAATLHWIHDHPAVFRSVRTALVPNGRFVAQCGGKGNLQGMLAHAGTLMASPPYREYFAEWREPWNFADAETTAGRLKAAGLTAIETWLEEAPADLETAEKYAEFVSCVCIRHHLDRLPPNLRGPFTNDLTARAASDDRPFTLDYWRLNIDARKPAA